LGKGLEQVGTIIQITDEVDGVTPRANAVIPIRGWAERDGTWTNVDGHHSRFRRALRPPPDALDGFELLVELCQGAGVKPPAQTVRLARKKLKQDPDMEVRQVADGRFAFPENQALYRHVGGVLEV